MKIANILWAVLLTVAFRVHAVQLESVAGTLHELVGDRDISELTLTGTVNAADIEWLGTNLTGLKDLNMTDVRILAYNGERLASGRTSSPDDVLPEFSLMGSSVTHITLPRALKGIGDAALSSTSITSITLTDGVQVIGMGAFAGCESLQNISMPESLTGIGDLAFKGCTALREIDMPGGVRIIGSEAFMGCTALERVTMPAGLETVGDRAFEGCDKLTLLKFPSTLTYVGHSAMSHTGLREADMSACSELRSMGGWVFAHCHDLETVSMSPATTAVGDGLFFDCRSLTAIDMSPKITALSPYMFKGASLVGDADLTGWKTENIGEYALYGNDKITQLWLPLALKSIGTRAMAGMTGLRRVDASYVKELPELGQEVFRGTAGKDVTLEAIDRIAEIMEVTEQWKEFNIVVVEDPDPSGVNNIEADARQGIDMKYDGATLTIIDRTAGIDMITVYALNGTVLERMAAGGESEVSLPLPRRAQTVVVELLQDNGVRVMFKIII